ncbi:MAG: drug/metabolite transporter (DMT)-like permease [Candidatus Azotimanducaceae bacterium]|jgi:drug/metabolite transporter (DMT)-like permease
MSGYAIAIIAALLWSFTNLIDKYLIQKYCKDGGIGALVILSALFPIVILPVAVLMSNQTIALPLLQIMILMISGVLGVGLLYFYLSALYTDEVSLVMPLFQITPLFALLFGFFVLAEMPTTTQLLFGGIVLFGAFILSIERTTGRIKIQLVLNVVLSSALIALTNTLFKFVAIDFDFWISIFWQALGTFATGIFLLIFHDRWRNEFKCFVTENLGLGVSLNAANEMLTICGDLLFAYAILLAPLALIQTTEAYQPVFVFIFGLLLTFFVPKWVHEDISRGAIIQKALGITIVVIGSALLALQ